MTAYGDLIAEDKVRNSLTQPDVVKDLADVLGPIGIFGTSTQNYDQFRLSPEEIEFYNNNGWVMTKNPVINSEQVEILRKELSLFLDPLRPHPGHHLFYEFHHNETNDPENAVLHCLGHWRITPAFHDIIYVPGIVVPTSQLMGAPVRFWHDQLFYKPPKYGGVVQWHQDYSYWTRTSPMNHLTVHIALDDQNIENGGLHYLNGSHRWTRDGLPLPPAAKKSKNDWKSKLDDASFDLDMDAIKSVLNENELKHWEEQPPVCANMRKGHATFHHPLTLHGSYQNRSEGPRRAAVVNYFADGTTTTVDGPLLVGTTVFKAGERLNGKFYPLVYDPTKPGKYSFE